MKVQIFSMMIYSWFQIGPVNGKCSLIQIQKKPAREVLFSRKRQIQNHPTLSLNNIQVERSTDHKHLGVILDEKLNFKEHSNTAISKVNKGISLIKKLRLELRFMMN